MRPPNALLRRPLAPAAKMLLSLGAALGALALAPAAAYAEPPTSEACVAAYETSQTLREEGHLRKARASLLVCAQEGCPEAARQDCVPWLAEVEAALPTAVITVSSELAPGDIVVTVDGAPVDWSAGRAIPLDPGPHTVVASHGERRVTKSVVIVEGAKGQAVALVLGADDAPPPAAGPAAAPAPSSGPSLVLPVTFGAVAVLGYGVFAGFGLAAMAEESSLEDTCSPSCLEADVDAVRTQRLLSGIGLGVGVAASVGFVLSLVLQDDDASSASAHVVPVGSGLGVSTRW